MATRRVVAVVAFARVGERDAGARCAALVPAETEDGALHGLHVVYLPFADDVRYPERAHDARIRARREDDDAEGSLGATEAQIRAAEQAVDALAVHSYDPSDISNPTLARHHRALESQALNRAWTADDDVAGDATEPPGEDELAALGAREPVEAFKTAAYGANHDEEVAAAMAAAGARGAKRKAAARRFERRRVDYKALAGGRARPRHRRRALKEYCKANGCRRQASRRRSWSASPRRDAREYAPRQLECSRPNRTCPTRRNSDEMNAREPARIGARGVVAKGVATRLSIFVRWIFSRIVRPSRDGGELHLSRRRPVHGE